MAELLLHIGYHKTGTTWLQQFLFTPEYGYQPLIHPSQRAEFGKNFILPSDLDVDTDSFQRKYALASKSILENGYKPVLSAERLSGAFQAGGYDSAVIASRLKAVFPGAKVLMVIRKQESMIFSSYVQYVRAGGTRTIRRLFQAPRRAPGFIPGFGIQHFQYDRLIGYYQQLFGKDQVLVLPYELFRADPTAFVNQIRQFSGLSVPLSSDLPINKKVNTSYGAFTIFWKRQFNWLFVDSSLNPGVWLPLAPGIEKRVVVLLQSIERLIPSFWKKRRLNQLKSQVNQQVKGQFAESNTRTEKLTGLNLSQWGYTLN